MCDPMETTCILLGSTILNLCHRLCDPLAQDCQDYEVCTVMQFYDYFVCQVDDSAEDSPTGSPCAYHDQCVEDNAPIAEMPATAAPRCAIFKRPAAQPPRPTPPAWTGSKWSRPSPRDQETWAFALRRRRSRYDPPNTWHTGQPPPAGTKGPYTRLLPSPNKDATTERVTPSGVTRPGLAQ